MRHCAGRADPSVKVLSLACGSEQAAANAEATVLTAAIPLSVGRSSSRVLVQGSISSILRLFGVNKSNVRQVGTDLCKAINKNIVLNPSVICKSINKKKPSSEQSDRHDATAGRVLLAASTPLGELTFGAESSIKPLAAALPSTALWMYMNPDVPNDPRIELPNPPVILDRRQFTLYDPEQDYSDAEGETHAGIAQQNETPMQSEDEGDSEGATSTASSTRGAATRIGAADLQRLLVASSERL